MRIVCRSSPKLEWYADFKLILTQVKDLANMQITYRFSSKQEWYADFRLFFTQIIDLGNMQVICRSSSKYEWYADFRLAGSYPGPCLFNLRFCALILNLVHSVCAHKSTRFLPIALYLS